MIGGLKSSSRRRNWPASLITRRNVWKTWNSTTRWCWKSVSLCHVCRARKSVSLCHVCRANLILTEIVNHWQNTHWIWILASAAYRFLSKYFKDISDMKKSRHLWLVKNNSGQRSPRNFNAGPRPQAGNRGVDWQIKHLQVLLNCQ